MDTNWHSLTALFDQLGLGSTNEEINKFLTKNRPVSDDTELHMADFWNASQATFLKEEKERDGDWAEVIDQLDVSLR